MGKFRINKIDLIDLAETSAVFCSPYLLLLLIVMQNKISSSSSSSSSSIGE